MAQFLEIQYEPSPLSPASLGLARALPGMQPHSSLVLPASPEFTLACILDSRPRINSDEESPFAEDFMGPRAKLQIEPGRSSREPPLDYQRWTKIGLSSRLPEPVPGYPGPWATPFCPFLAKTGGSRWAFFFVAIIFPVQAAADGLYGSQ